MKVTDFFSHCWKDCSVRWRHDSIISQAISFKRCSKCWRNSASGQWRSRMKDCSASSFQKRSSDVAQPFLLFVFREFFFFRGRGEVFCKFCATKMFFKFFGNNFCDLLICDLKIFWVIKKKSEKFDKVVFVCCAAFRMNMIVFHCANCLCNLMIQIERKISIIISSEFNQIWIL